MKIDLTAKAAILVLVFSTIFLLGRANLLCVEFVIVVPCARQNALEKREIKAIFKSDRNKFLKQLIKLNSIPDSCQSLQNKTVNE